MTSNTVATLHLHVGTAQLQKNRLVELGDRKMIVAFFCNSRKTVKQVLFCYAISMSR